MDHTNKDRSVLDPTKPYGRLRSRRRLREIVETFRTKSGRSRSIRLDDHGQQCLDRLVSKTGLKRTIVLQQVAASLPPALKGTARASAIRAALHRWDETSEEPQSYRKKSPSPRSALSAKQPTDPAVEEVQPHSPSSGVGSAATGIATDNGLNGKPPPTGPAEAHRTETARVPAEEPNITVRDTALIRVRDHSPGWVWRFSIRLSIAPTSNKRISIVGDDCDVRIAPVDNRDHLLFMMLRNIHINGGPVRQRADLTVAADLHFVAQTEDQAWAAPKPTRLTAMVFLVGVMQRWTKRLVVDLVWVPTADHAVRWAGYGEAAPKAID